MISGEQLVHSRYLQQLCSLGLLLRLDSVLCTQPAPVHVAHPEPGKCNEGKGLINIIPPTCVKRLPGGKKPALFFILFYLFVHLSVCIECHR